MLVPIPSGRCGFGGWRLATGRQESAGVETAADEADGFIIDWLVGPDRSLGRYRYRLDRTIAKGLEGKPCYVFHATDAPAGCPFSVLVAMDPMPERAALASGSVICIFSTPAMTECC